LPDSNWAPWLAELLEGRQLMPESNLPPTNSTDSLGNSEERRPRVPPLVRVYYKALLQIRRLNDIAAIVQGPQRQDGPLYDFDPTPDEASCLWRIWTSAPGAAPSEPERLVEWENLEKDVGKLVPCLADDECEHLDIKPLALQMYIERRINEIKERAYWKKLIGDLEQRGDLTPEAQATMDAARLGKLLDRRQEEREMRKIEKKCPSILPPLRLLAQRHGFKEVVLTPDVIHVAPPRRYLSWQLHARRLMGVVFRHHFTDHFLYEVTKFLELSDRYARVFGTETKTGRFQKAVKKACRFLPEVEIGGMGFATAIEALQSITNRLERVITTRFEMGPFLETVLAVAFGNGLAIPFRSGKIIIFGLSSLVAVYLTPDGPINAGIRPDLLWAVRLAAAHVNRKDLSNWLQGVLYNWDTEALEQRVGQELSNLRKYVREKTDSRRRRDPRPVIAEPMSETEKAVFELLTALPAGEALTGSEIISRLGAKGIPIEQSTLTRHIIPKLKEHGVRNRRNVGYYVERISN
jgi:hypothetical protein